MFFQRPKRKPQNPAVLHRDFLATRLVINRQSDGCAYFWLFELCEVIGLNVHDAFDQIVSSGMEQYTWGDKATNCSLREDVVDAWLTFFVRIDQVQECLRPEVVKRRSVVLKRLDRGTPHWLSSIFKRKRGRIQ